MSAEQVLTGKAAKILRMLYDDGKMGISCMVDIKQSKLADNLGITRQALNVHLRKMRNMKLVRTGRGFLEITDEGLKMLGFSKHPAFVFVKVSPQHRVEAYAKISALPVRQLFRVAGDVDLLFIVERERLEKVLESISLIEGIEDTHSYIAIEALK